MLSKISQAEANTVQYVDSKKYNKLMNITKLEDSQIQEQTSGYQWWVAIQGWGSRGTTTECKVSWEDV